MRPGVRRLLPQPLVIIISVVGLVLTSAASWTALHLDHVTERRLLQQQTKQAGSVLSTAVLLIQQPLVNALAVQTSTPGMTASTERLLSKSVGASGQFVDASIWQRRGGTVHRIVTLGAKPAMSTAAPATQAFLQASYSKKTFSVTTVLVGTQRRIVYALADPRTGYLIFAERALPANRRAPVASDSAFAELHYAIYVGPATLANLSTTDVDPAALPLKGITATVVVPFGDTELTLTTSRHGHLGAALSQWLWLILLIAGLVLTGGTVFISRLLDERRRNAEEHAEIATGMSERLQRALLPLTIPSVPQLEVAVEYLAGDTGVAIGGDWYSFVALGPDHYGFVVGDVSGRGIDAVAVMARARFTIRAYLLRGDSPEVALSASSHHFDINDDQHIATTIVGIGNWRTGEVTVANAGHCRPLIIGADGPRFHDTKTGPPLGTGPFAYETTSFVLSPGDIVLCYTDGLIERRNETIDTGMRRLATVVASTAQESVEQIVQRTVRTMRTEQHADDTAVLAFRWLGA
ncbi:MAG: PP2C family protein-serine/threonine phosphatase [Marmoricola sp.]